MKEPFEKYGMCAAQHHLGAFRCTQNIEQIGANGIPLPIALFSDLLFKRNNRFCSPQVDENIPPTDLLHGSRNNFSDAPLIIFVDFFAFGFSDPLDEYLPRRLNRIASKIGKIEAKSHFPTDLCTCVCFACLCYANLDARIFDRVVGNDFFDRFNDDLARAIVDVDFHIIPSSKPLFCRRY